MIAYQLTREKRDQILALIEEHLETAKPYLKHGYSLRNLSEDLDVTYTYLSFIINREYGLNFNDLINRYRIKYLRSLMESPDAHMYTLEGLANQAGFSSRSTFYRAFQKTTGQMPSAFMRDMLIAN
jgi:AraC-like DNA-binding protein